MRLSKAQPRLHWERHGQASRGQAWSLLVLGLQHSIRWGCRRERASGTRGTWKKAKCCSTARHRKCPVKRERPIAAAGFIHCKIAPACWKGFWGGSLIMACLRPRSASNQMALPFPKAGCRLPPAPTPSADPPLTNALVLRVSWPLPGRKAQGHSGRLQQDREAGKCRARKATPSDHPLPPTRARGLGPSACDLGVPDTGLNSTPRAWLLPTPSLAMWGEALSQGCDFPSQATLPRVFSK